MSDDSLRDLLDDYLDGRLDEQRLRQLEERLRADPEARRLFVRHARLHTDLQLDVQARRAGRRALGQIDQLTPPRRIGLLRRVVLGGGVSAAAVLLAVAVGWWLVAAGAGGNQAVAWLVNAQDCTWADGEPDGDLRAGKVLKIERGLAEVRFECGARVVLEGPASLELVSVRSARLLRGKLTARVPGPAVRFELLSPQGRVTDLGTEFGVQVSDAGATDVHVFEGKVEARFGSDQNAAPVSLTQNQSARIDAGTVTVRPKESGERFVRAIVPAPTIVPRTLRLTFDRAVAGSLLDRGGLGTGLTHRLPGTGEKLAARDANLKVNAANSRLELTTTNSDINRQFRLAEGEYLGVRLADVGFTGAEDFAVTATFPDIPALEFVGQFGLYAGSRSDRNIRGGVISSRRGEPGQYTQFLVNNDGGRDTDPHRVGLLTTGTDLRLTLKRTAGKYTLTVENLTAGGASTLSIRHPAFLDGDRDLHVGLFGANTQSEVRKTVAIKDFQATVWTVTPR
jgi:ferric-dicitrate binding protein FerR (iron transport regulator)